MSVSVREWEEACALANRIIAQSNPVCKDVHETASTIRIGISAIAMATSAMAHQAAGMALLAGNHGEEVEAYHSVLRHIAMLIEYRLDESMASAKELLATLRGEAVH